VLIRADAEHRPFADDFMSGAFGHEGIITP